MSGLAVGLVGAGTMGANHARVVAASPHAHLAVVVDPDQQRAAGLAAEATVSESPEAVFGCDAVIVASPTDSHTGLALDLIERGVPVLVEKPLAPDFPQAQAIVAAAERDNVPLLCGFVERFNAAVTTAHTVLEEPPVHLVSIRHSPPTPRITTSVVYDLLIHDIDLALGLLDSPVTDMTGATSSDPDTGTAEIADCTLRFAGGAVATLSASRASQRKIRWLLVTTPTALVEIDLLRQDVTVYRNVRHNQVGDTPTYRAETIVDIPFVRHHGEPLVLQFEHFVRLVHGDADAAVERASLLTPHRIAAELACDDEDEADDDESPIDLVGVAR